MTSSRAEFCIENNVYSPGDQIPVIVHVDNSKCQHRVDKLKFKLWRQVTYMLEGKKITTGEYLSQVKIDGCKAKSQSRHEYQIPIDLVEADGKTWLAGTCSQKDYQVQYYLRCFVKHASVFEMGQGHCLQFPLHIVHKPDDRLTEEPFDKMYRVNARTAEFDDRRDGGDCVFDIKRDGFWRISEAPSQLKFVEVKNDHELSRVKYENKIINDFDSVPLPLVGEKGIVCIGFE